MKGVRCSLWFGFASGWVIGCGGSDLLFEARVTTAAGTPAGTVTFTIGACGSPGVALGQATLNSEGVARLNRKIESVGTFCIMADYSGSGTHAPSQSPPPGLAQVIVLRR